MAWQVSYGVVPPPEHRGIFWDSSKPPDPDKLWWTSLHLKFSDREKAAAFASALLQAEQIVAVRVDEAVGPQGGV